MTRNTTENQHFAQCRRLCRVYFIGHSAKTVFAECQIKYTRQKKHSTKCVFAECLFLALGKDLFYRVLFFGTWQNASLPSAFFWHSAKMYFAECYFSAHGKMRLCRVPLFWHSAKSHFAVCIFFGPRQIIFSKQFLRP